MSFSCREIGVLLPPYAAEELSASERRAVREHLTSCGDCRSEAAAADPTLLFAGPVPIEDISAADAARILEGVRAAVAVRQAERRLASGQATERGAVRRRAGWRRPAKVAAAAAVALLTLALPGGLSRGARAPSSAGQAARTPAAGVAAAASRPSAAAEAPPPGATVYEIAPGRGPNEPRVVWIVDGSLDI